MNELISIRGIFIILGVTPLCTCKAVKAEQNENNPRISFAHISPKRLEMSDKNILVILYIYFNPCCLFVSRRNNVRCRNAILCNSGHLTQRTQTQQEYEEKHQSDH